MYRTRRGKHFWRLSLFTQSSHWTHPTRLSRKSSPKTRKYNEKWQWYFAHGKQADARKERLPVRALDPESIVLDIGPETNARIIGPDGKLVGLVVRNFLPERRSDGVGRRCCPGSGCPIVAISGYASNFIPLLCLFKSFMSDGRHRETYSDRVVQQALAASLLSIG